MNDYKHIIKFLNDNKYAISSDEFNKQISSHPDHPSLYSITDTFSFLNIESVSAKVPKEEFDNLPETFLAIVNENNRQIIVYVKKKSDGQIIYSSANKIKKISKDLFLEIWEQIVVAIDPNESSEDNKKSIYNNWMVLGYTLTSLLAILYFLNSNPSVSSIIFFSTSIMGLIVSIFIVREDLGLHSETIRKICNSGKNSDCVDVITSKGSFVAGTISLGDLCIIYFSSLVLICLNRIDVFDYIFLINSFFSIVLSIYSLYYQAFVIKKWCFLCLSIIFILAIQFTVLIYSGLSTFNIDSIFVLILYLSLMSFLWLGTKSRLKKLSQLKNLEIDFLKLKRNKKIFQSLLKNEKSFYTDDLSEIPGLELGRASEDSMIYGVLSPSCHHCISAFKTYNELANTSPDNQHIKILFNLNPENKENEYLKVGRTIIDILLKKGNAAALTALNEWYESGLDIVLWNKSYNFQESEESNNILRKQYYWCRNNEINYTPATIYQNHLLPLEFQTSDLKYFIEHEN
ncbi:vitamin K epoxide reductase family protein [Moheibacter sediminis]|uniref:Peptidase C39 family protein n=1 Tax=Moheibacter sediminis TaxID=1434700 RepID=A0A1W2D1S7_9FLAO|nr:vitamin K epoxide reductase family protein [Moheibacter sediminis]SMC90968.1 Peptidase C39 family protein [Moheibacter sediminis]